MKNRHRGNALLVELLIVVLFFMLASTILLQVFAASRNQSEKAIITTEALTSAQNAAERLYNASGDTDKALAGMNFAFDAESGTWTLETETYTLAVSLETDKTEAGCMYKYVISALYNDETLFSLNAQTYAEALS